MEILDIRRLVDVSDGDTAFLQEVLSEYEGTVPVLIQALSNALDPKNGLELQCQAYDLRGSSRAVGANSIAILSEKLEQAAKHEAWNECANLLSDIKEVWVPTRLAVQKAA